MVRRAILALAVAILLTGPTAIAFFSGGYWEEPRVWAGLVACGLALVAAVFAPAVLPRSLAGRIALAGLVLLAAWTAASVGWAPVANQAWQDTERLVLYALGLAAAVALLRPPLPLRALEPALAGGILIVIGQGLSERVLPGVVHLGRDLSAAGRLSQPLTYWNAEGALAAIGAILCLRLAGDTRRPVAVRAAGAAASVPLVVGVYLSFSRGAIAAVLAGVVLLVVLSPTRPQVRALAVAVPAGVVASVVASAFAGVRELHGGLATRESQGAAMLAVLVVLAAAAALRMVFVARRERAGSLRLDRFRMPPRPVLYGGAALAAIAVVLLVAALHERQVTKAVAASANPNRLVTLESDRYGYWKVAGRAFLDHPIIGLGSRGFAVEWLKHRHSQDFAKDAHSLYVETAAELGLIGLLALGLFGGGTLACAVRAHRLDPQAATGLIAAVGVFAVHAGLDWDWEMPAVSLVALALIGGLIALAEGVAPAGAAPSTAAATIETRDPQPVA